jgi:hypothetical protein
VKLGVGNIHFYVEGIDNMVSWFEWMKLIFIVLILYDICKAIDRLTNKLNEIKKELKRKG